MIRSILILAVILSFTSCPVTGSAQDKNPLAQEVEVPLLPNQLDFAGERVPLNDFEIREALQRDLTVLCYWHSAMLYTLQLSHRYFPVIEPILKQYGVPDDFKYLCVAESNLQNVVSPSKAEGFWQMLAGTGKQYGLEINDEVDERYHLEKATVAACRYLKVAYARFGSWTLAAASYNVGMTHISNQITRQQTKSFYDMWLNDETTRYIYRSLSFKLIMGAPEKYGFIINKANEFPPLRYKEISVKGSIDTLANFAKDNGTNYKMIKYFNPWLRSDKLTNKNEKTYMIKIPEKGYRENAYQ